MSTELSDQEQYRRQSLIELRKLGIEPYPAALYPTNAFSVDIKNSFKDSEEKKQVCVAGRIMSRRI
ncbi:MAG TPA: lysine--tRNA ligase, partial [Paludibacteraceae bacterium]|nr:lysine--tRNA ligase [Paludibacteraceae bacterium]